MTSPLGAAWRGFQNSVPALDRVSSRGSELPVDTALPSPDDALWLDEGPIIPVLHTYRIEARSMIILVSEA